MCITDAVSRFSLYRSMARTDTGNGGLTHPYFVSQQREVSEAVSYRVCSDPTSALCSEWCDHKWTSYMWIGCESTQDALRTHLRADHLHYGQGWSGSHVAAFFHCVWASMKDRLLNWHSLQKQKEACNSQSTIDYTLTHCNANYMFRLSYLLGKSADVWEHSLFQLWTTHNTPRRP